MAELTRLQRKRFRSRQNNGLSYNASHKNQLQRKNDQDENDFIGSSIAEDGSTKNRNNFPSLETPEGLSVKCAQDDHEKVSRPIVNVSSLILKLCSFEVEDINKPATPPPRYGAGFCDDNDDERVAEVDPSNLNIVSSNNKVSTNKQMFLPPAPPPTARREKRPMCGHDQARIKQTQRSCEEIPPSTPDDRGNRGNVLGDPKEEKDRLSLPLSHSKCRFLDGSGMMRNSALQIAAPASHAFQEVLSGLCSARRDSNNER